MTGLYRLGELLREPTFLRVWLVGACSGVARWFELLVVGVFAFEVTGSPFLVAFLVILRFLPLAVFGSIVGTFADRVPPRLLLLAGMSLATLVGSTLCILFAIGIAEYWHVAVATFASGLIWTTDMSIRRRMLGDAAGRERLAPAMSLDSATNNGTRMLGPLLGGVLYQFLGPVGAFALTATLYAVSVVLTLGVPAAVSVVPGAVRSSNILRDFQDGFRLAANDRDLLRILLVTVVFNVWGFPFVSMIPVIGKEELTLSAAWIGGLAAMEGAGAFLGALVIAVSARQAAFRRIYYLGVLGYLSFIFIAGWLHSPFAIAAMFLCVGLSGSCFSTMQSTLTYSVAPPEMRSRVFGLLTICIGTGLIGFCNIGLMGEWFGGSAAIRIVAAEGLIPLLLIGIGWQQLKSGGAAG